MSIISKAPNQAIEAKIKHSLKIINTAVDVYNLDAFFVLLSGGNDSMALTHVASAHPLFAGVIHIDTQTGITDSNSWETGKPDSIATRYTRDICKLNRWELIAKTPATSYEQVTIEYGFPGPPQHGMMYRFLKERPLRQARKEARKLGGKNIGFVTGVRSSESIRRMGNVEAYNKNSEGIWVSPLIHWHKSDCQQVINAINQPKNPVSIAMGMSGECGCGAYATRDEKQVIDSLYPEHGKRIDFWEQGVKHFQSIKSIKETHCYWGHAQGDRVIGDRTVTEIQRESDGQQDFFGLCTSCIGSQFDRQMGMKIKNRQLSEIGD